MHSQPYRRYVVGLLLLVYIFNQVDRAVFGFLMEHIKRDLSLSDSQLGFLAGPALVFFYATLGIPIARFADRSNRVNIISIAMALWSAIVCLSAAVTSFGQLALARVGVGVGEAGFAAIAQSLISDYHSPAQRTRALSIFMLGLPLGAVLSSLIAGWVTDSYGWRAAFLIAGVPGIALVLLVKLTLKEPSRATASDAAQAAQHQPALRAVFATLLRSRSLRHLAIGMTLMNMVSACAHTWLPTFFIRSHGMSTAQLGTWFAVITGIGAVVGTWMSGFLVARLSESNERLLMRIVALSAALNAPFLIGALLWPSAVGALIVLIPAYVLYYFLLGPTWSLLQGLSASSMRATMAAIVILAQTLIAGMVGLQSVGIMSDALTATFGSDALRWSLVLISAIALWAGVHLWIAGHSIRQDRASLAMASSPA